MIFSYTQRLSVDLLHAAIVSCAERRCKFVDGMINIMELMAKFDSRVQETSEERRLLLFATHRVC